MPKRTDRSMLDSWFIGIARIKWDLEVPICGFPRIHKSQLNVQRIPLAGQAPRGFELIPTIIDEALPAQSGPGCLPIRATLWIRVSTYSLQPKAYGLVILFRTSCEHHFPLEAAGS